MTNKTSQLSPVPAELPSAVTFQEIDVVVVETDSPLRNGITETIARKAADVHQAIGPELIAYGGSIPRVAVAATVRWVGDKSAKGVERLRTKVK